MQLRVAQVGIQQQHAASMLAHDDLGQVRRSEGFAFLGKGAGDQQLGERLLFARLIQAAAQGAEFLHAGAVFLAAEKQHGLWVGSPTRLAATRKHGISRHGRGDRGAGHVPNSREPARGFDRFFQHRGARLRQGALLFGFLQGFVNSTHSFPSLGTSGSGCFSCSASLESVLSASTRSNLSPLGGGGGTAAI